jgi:hypothetical protein
MPSMPILPFIDKGGENSDENGGSHISVSGHFKLGNTLLELKLEHELGIKHEE